VCVNKKRIKLSQRVVDGKGSPNVDRHNDRSCENFGSLSVITPCARMKENGNSVGKAHGMLPPSTQHVPVQTSETMKVAK